MPQKGVQTHCIQTPSLFSPRLLQESEAPSITSSFDGLKAHAARAAAENAEPKTGGKLTETQNMEAIWVIGSTCFGLHG